MIDKYIVITTINDPNEAIIKYRNWKGWKLIVVGDRKTNKFWSASNVIYLDIEEQKRLYGELSEHISENTYKRKMLGYIWAIQHGAKAIFETDDDNFPYKEAQKAVESVIDNKHANEIKKIGNKNGWVNIYREFGINNCWPRGFPIDLISDKTPNIYLKNNKNDSLGLVQYLVDLDPDVDAIYRMTSINSEIKFKKKDPIILNVNSFCPINSQATLWLSDYFPLMFFPLGVSDRVTDILRGYIALACLWKMNKSVSYHSPIVYQLRNNHNLLNDFKEESFLYLNARILSKILLGVKGDTPSKLYLSALNLLVENNYLSQLNTNAYLQFLNNIDVTIFEK